MSEQLKTEAQGGVRKSLEADSRQMRLLIFQLDSEYMAVDIGQVVEVLSYKSPRPMPFTKPFYLGVINLRGSLISILDMRLLQGLPISEEGSRLTMLIELKASTLGLVVDRLISVVDIDPDQIDARADIESRMNRDVIQGVLHFRAELVTVVDLRSYLSGLDVKQLPAGISVKKAA